MSSRFETTIQRVTSGPAAVGCQFGPFAPGSVAVSLRLFAVGDAATTSIIGRVAYFGARQRVINSAVMDSAMFGPMPPQGPTSPPQFIVPFVDSSLVPLPWWMPQFVVPLNFRFDRECQVLAFLAISVAAGQVDCFLELLPPFKELSR